MSCTFNYTVAESSPTSTCICIYVHCTCTSTSTEFCHPTSIEFARYHFGSGIVGAATAGPQELSVLHQIAQTKVCDLDTIGRVQQQVFWLQVPVHHLVPGGVCEGGWGVVCVGGGWVCEGRGRRGDVCGKGE